MYGTEQMSRSRIVKHNMFHYLRDRLNILRSQLEHDVWNFEHGKYSMAVVVGETTRPI